MSKLHEVLPKEFVAEKKHRKTKAFKFKDINVTKEHSYQYEQDRYEKWPGEQKNVFFWVELDNGYAVGINENIKNNGWSFPVIKL